MAPWVEHLNGEKIEKKIVLPTMTVTKENADQIIKDVVGSFSASSLFPSPLWGYGWGLIGCGLEQICFLRQCSGGLDDVSSLISIDESAIFFARRNFSSRRDHNIPPSGPPFPFDRSIQPK
jgi:hypothetical protein